MCNVTVVEGVSVFRCSGRLQISLTRWRDNQNVVVTEYASNEELIDVSFGEPKGCVGTLKGVVLEFSILFCAFFVGFSRLLRFCYLFYILTIFADFSRFIAVFRP